MPKSSRRRRRLQNQRSGSTVSARCWHHSQRRLVSRWPGGHSLTGSHRFWEGSLEREGRQGGGWCRQGLRAASLFFASDLEGARPRVKFTVRGQCPRGKITSVSPRESSIHKSVSASILLAGMRLCLSWLARRRREPRSCTSSLWSTYSPWRGSSVSPRAQAVRAADASGKPGLEPGTRRPDTS